MKRILLAAVTATSALALNGNALAQAWPTKPVRIVVGYGAGGPGDIIARALAVKLGAAWGHGRRPGRSPRWGCWTWLAASARPSSVVRADGATCCASPIGPCLSCWIWPERCWACHPCWALARRACGRWCAQPRAHSIVGIPSTA